MIDEEKIRKCIELVWDYEENYDGDDLLNFQNKELSTYTQYESIVTTFNKYIQFEKENEQLKKELDSYKALDSKYDEIEEDTKVIAKENEGLKKNLERYSQKIAEQEETIDAQDDKINFYVSKMNENILKRQELEKENKICEEIIIGEQQEINRLEKENAELKMKLLALENKEQVVTTTLSN